ncbi:hypothetical protein SS209_04348 [Salmonella enterica subsp. enterica serovar Senftenberg str. SS209]|nr:hypothetical protein SS209_04348 [Salmonella enterica subsp. enterica serovar Senftenberg str. SS209]
MLLHAISDNITAYLH